MKNILISGGCGFIGCNFIKFMLQKYDYQIINIDLLTYAGNLENLKELEGDERYSFIQGDICDAILVEKVFSEYEIDAVINFAAESHVDRSIENPRIFLRTNVFGTQVLLDTAKKNWKLYPKDKYSKEYKQGVKYIQISTDEVYGTLGAEGLFTETTTLSPNSPYSASKAGADLMIRAYYETFSLPVNITRCSNNYGPYQFPEKLIPLAINNCMNSKEIPVYGDGLQVRDWLHVKDHCRAIDMVLHHGKMGEIYNIGGKNERKNIEIIKLIIHSLGCEENLIKYIKDRPGHDRRYAIDNTKIIKELNWVPKYNFEQGIKETIRWYLENKDWMKNVMGGEYRQYYNSMYR